MNQIIVIFNISAIWAQNRQLDASLFVPSYLYLYFCCVCICIFVGLTVCALLEWDGTEKRGYQRKTSDWTPILPKTDLQDNWLHKSCFPQILKQHFPSNNINFLQYNNNMLMLMLLVLLCYFILLTALQDVFVQYMKVALQGPACSTEKGCKEKLLHL